MTNYINGHTSPYHQVPPVEVLCICHSKRKTGRLETSDIETIVII